MKTIAEVRIAKDRLAEQIAHLVTQFELVNDVQVAGIDITPIDCSTKNGEGRSFTNEIDIYLDI